MGTASDANRLFRLYSLLLIGHRFLAGITFYSIVSTLFLQSRGLNLTEVFSLESWLAVALFLLEVPSGTWADRFDRKRVLFVGMLLNVAATYLFAVASDYWLFVLSYLLSGVGIAILSGTESAYIYDLLKDLRREEASSKVFGWLIAAEKAATLLGLPAGSWLAGFGLAVPVYATAVANTLGLLLWLLMPAQRVSPGPEDQEDRFQVMNWQLVRRSLKLILTTPTLVFLAVIGPAVWVIVNAAHYLNQPLYLRGNIPVEQFGWVMGISTAISMLAGVLAPKAQSRLGSLSSIILSSTLIGLAYAGLAFSTHIVPITLLMGLLFGSLALRAPIMTTVANALIPSEIRATTLSLLSAVGTVLTVALNPLIGYLADRSLTFSLLFCGGSVMALTLISFPVVRNIIKNEAQGSQTGG